MAEYWTCIECEFPYDDDDGDVEERMCNKCIDKIYDESLDAKKKDRVKLVMDEFDELIDMVTE